MTLPDPIRNSKLLRWPLLVASRLLLLPLRGGPAIFRRAVYDVMPTPYLVTGNRELFIVSTADKVIGRELFLHGEFDFGKLEAALSILDREGHARPTHLIDVGANIGTIVIPALKRGLMQTATAIEPHPGNLKLLQANLALNDLARQVEVLEIAVGDRDGDVLKLTESATNSGNHSIGMEGIPVASRRLDDLAIPKLDALLWMDIEGYEGHALRGALQIISNKTPIVSEFNPQFLFRTGGLTAFMDSLSGRRIFDLSSPRPKETTLEELKNEYEFGFTDILAIWPQ